jgi:hypothetical protein
MASSPGPNDNRPAWLNAWALVEGVITSAPLDLPGRFDQVVQQLQHAGWRVSVKSIGTDFGFIPLPKDQPLAVYLWRPGAFTAAQAQAALAEVLGRMNLSYSPIRAWVAEVVREAVAPAAEEAKTWGLVAVVVVAGLVLLGGRRR